MGSDGASLKQKVVKGAVWTLLERLSTQAVGFVVSMILARLLTPDDYGTVALTAIFFAVTGSLVDCGFGDALVQKKDADELDFNSVFYLGLALSLVAYAALFLAAPWIAAFYKTPVLVPIVRVSAISFVFGAFNSIQNAEMTKKMLFNLSFRISLVTCATSAVCGLTLAFMGFGVWALVGSSLVTGFVGVVTRWLVIAWRPRLMFSFARLKPLFAFGWKMAASGVLNQFFVNLNGLIIGRFYAKADLAFVNKGQSIPSLAMGQVNDTLGRVTFPALVQLQDDRAKLREAMRRLIQCSTFLVFPLMTGVAICAKPILLLLFGEQWTPAAPYMRLACFSFALWPFHTINLRAITVLGRSDVFLTLEIVKKVLSLTVMLTAYRYGVFAFMAVSAFALGPLGVIINSWPNRRLLNYTVGMQLRDVLPSALLCAAMAAAVLGVGAAFDGSAWAFARTQSVVSLVALLALQGVVGAALYFAFAWLFRLAPLREYLRIVSNLMQTKRSYEC